MYLKKEESDEKNALQFWVNVYLQVCKFIKSTVGQTSCQYTSGPNASKNRQKLRDEY